jgi:hypothetical protein
LQAEIGERPDAGKDEDARQPRPGKPGQCAGHRDEDADREGQPGHREGHQPPELRRLQQDRLGDPVEADKVKPEAEDQTDQARRAGGAGAADQPEKSRQADPKRGQDIRRG